MYKIFVEAKNLICSDAMYGCGSLKAWMAFVILPPKRMRRSI